jgi:hypothetical protein
MKRFISIFASVFILANITHAQLILNDVTLPAKLSFDKQILVLNGGGVRSKYLFKLYTIGLYLEQKSNDARAIVNADKIMAVRFEITSTMISSDNIKAAINEGFDKSTKGESEKIRNEIDNLLNAFSKEEINVGDVFDIVYLPGVGLQTYKNNKLKSTVQTLYFKQALFGIWLSDNPISDKLKKDMLGQ